MDAENQSINHLENECEVKRAQMTCGENLEKKIAVQKERLAKLEAAKEEMHKTGLYNVKMSILREIVSL